MQWYGGSNGPFSNFSHPEGSDALAWRSGWFLLQEAAEFFNDERLLQTAGNKPAKEEGEHQRHNRPGLNDSSQTCQPFPSLIQSSRQDSLRFARLRVNNEVT